MSAADGIFARRDKKNDAQTVLYEIDLLRFARDRLFSPPETWTERDEWVYLEAFLLHYRNLIEFFGKEHLADGDLSIRNPRRIWIDREPDKADLEFMTRPDLRKKYDMRDDCMAISKYLHHCTEQRAIARPPWYVKAMYEELQPVIERFESLLPGYEPVPESLTITRGLSSKEGNSTASTRAPSLRRVPAKRDGAR
jgi:hypothetical protein